MCTEKDNSENGIKEDNDMAIPFANPKRMGLQDKLKYITKKATKLKATKDAIELDPNDKQHQEWFFKDKYRGR